MGHRNITEKADMPLSGDEEFSRLKIVVEQKPRTAYLYDVEYRGPAGTTKSELYRLEPDRSRRVHHVYCQCGERLTTEGFDNMLTAQEFLEDIIERNMHETCALKKVAS